MHQILKSIVTLAVNTPECRDLARFFNLKSEIINHAASTLGELSCDKGHPDGAGLGGAGFATVYAAHSTVRLAGLIE